MGSKSKYNFIHGILEHRIIMEKHLGRQLDRFECVHHINGNGKDNQIENLEIMTLQEHTRLHKLKYPNGNIITLVCSYCNNKFKRKYDTLYSQNVFCSGNCFSRYRIAQPKHTIILTCTFCQREFERLYKSRPEATGAKNVFCSRPCQGQFQRSNRS